MSYFADTVNQIFSNAQALTGGTAFDSTNVIDLGATPTLRDMGIRPRYVRLIVTTAFTAVGDGGSEFTSLNVSVKTDSTTNMDTSETVHVSKDIALASLTLGAEFILQLPPGQTYERYMGIEYTSTAETAATGAITAVLVPNYTSTQYHADGSSIS